jgi:hypothetical protein
MSKFYNDVLKDLETYLHYQLAAYQDSALKIPIAGHNDTGMVDEENTVKASVENVKST